MSDVVKGDRYRTMGCDVEVRRVAKDGTWADIFVYELTSRTSWTKRQRLPFPSSWRLLEVRRS
jgi:hypothetical protein